MEGGGSMHITRWINRLPITNFFYPNKCICCEKILKIDVWPPICEKCEREFKPYAGYRWTICDRPIEHEGCCSVCNEHKLYYDKGYCVYPYADDIRMMLLKCKYDKEPRFCDFFGKQLYEYMSDKISEYDVITSVPMYVKKQRVRGYNQAELIALELAERGGVEYRVLLRRKVETTPQSSLNKNDRAKNVIGAFEAVTEPLYDKRILIVDDILTTGSTLNECSKMLKGIGAAQVDIAAFGAVKLD
jgi:ComF family protein